MLFAISDAVWLAAISGASSVMLGVLGIATIAVKEYFDRQRAREVAAKVEDVRTAAQDTAKRVEAVKVAAEKTAGQVGEVKNTLETNTTTTDAKLDRIDNKLNGGMTVQLKLNAVTMRELANLKGTQASKDAAALAEKSLAEHELAVAESKKG